VIRDLPAAKKRQQPERLQAVQVLLTQVRNLRRVWRALPKLD